jgi:hypothetical protein
LRLIAAAYNNKLFTRSKDNGFAQDSPFDEPALLAKPQDASQENKQN